MSKSSLVIGAAAGLVALATAAFFGSPYFAAAQAVAALRSAEPARIEAVVDFAALKADMRVDAEASVAAMLEREGVSADRAALARGFLGPLADGLIEGVATPEGLAELMKHSGEKAQAATFGEILAATIANGAYAAPGFVVALPEKDQPKAEAIKLAFARRGLVSWKLVGVDAPTDAAEAKK